MTGVGRFLPRYGVQTGTNRVASYRTCNTAERPASETPHVRLAIPDELAVF